MDCCDNSGSINVGGGSSSHSTCDKLI